MVTAYSVAVGSPLNRRPARIARGWSRYPPGTHADTTRRSGGLSRLVYFFDILAAVVFAVSGALVASRKGMDVMVRSSYVHAGRRPAGLRAVALVLAIGLAAAPGGAAQDRPVQTVEKVELSRYVGEWFEIARFPNRFQRQCLGDVRAAYAIRQDGRLDVVNRCRTDDGITEARGVARIVDARSAAKLKVRFAPAILSFLPAVWGDYWVLGLAPNYSWATVGSPDRQYLWILGRTPSIGADPYAAALEAARANGFDVARLVMTEQGPAR